MTMTNVHDLADRRRSLELVAEAFHLAPAAGRPSVLLRPSTSRRNRLIVRAEGPSE